MTLRQVMKVWQLYSHFTVLPMHAQGGLLEPAISNSIAELLSQSVSNRTALYISIFITSDSPEKSNIIYSNINILMHTSILLLHYST